MRPHEPFEKVQTQLSVHERGGCVAKILLCPEIVVVLIKIVLVAD